MKSIIFVLIGFFASAAFGQVSVEDWSGDWERPCEFGLNAKVVIGAEGAYTHTETSYFTPDCTGTPVSTVVTTGKVEFGETIESGQLKARQISLKFSKVVSEYMDRWGNGSATHKVEEDLTHVPKSHSLYYLNGDMYYSAGFYYYHPLTSIFCELTPFFKRASN